MTSSWTLEVFMAPFIHLFPAKWNKQPANKCLTVQEELHGTPPPMEKPPTEPSQSASQSASSALFTHTTSLSTGCIRLKIYKKKKKKGRRLLFITRLISVIVFIVRTSEAIGKLKDSESQNVNRKKRLEWEEGRGDLEQDYKFIFQFRCWKQGMK